ncbi:MAG: fibrillarin-like rRNA/tRNA 2'-O-methyltransferase [Nitrososphaeraceae archaeon]|jgi:fibrillarin-like pre-rRNA processing protein|nr:fibrillarin-like rRNA/tRNA 2'-O-methyltransferase [Nitrososphaeraceae archaeon]MDW0141760.1 fibrillarin-like rRNA/tRNA 2'-O-methyltransferase [Nitrososphaeraceae archaeon]MDW0144471.1 fibrillarin-like rRNA/tRNA 2'-O-methyltransferase [Nitrososphaeraceae archaeon]MDW0145229.1 fibrillarin-like rRNA/tRNA 2'-O-methyltransferase [Nitrososphaeraceae archaeon]MDW0147655.1 fibrillarin-like rRNA/tRNA 2'-O-methyltransferase [Nitrososphaeraceae archaeon]
MKNVDAISYVTVNGKEHIATINLLKGVTLYGEKLISRDGNEYRTWDPFRSKLAAAYIKGLHFEFSNVGNVLYLGASTGTTVSHLSDIVGQSGKIFAVESSARVARELISNVSSKRTNVIPIIEDARKPRSYFSIYDKMDLVYCDIAQPDQTTIAIDNCKIYLKEAKPMLLVIKTRSIDVTMSPKNVISQEIKKLESNSFEIKQKIDLEPFDKDHAMINAVFYPK